MDTRKLRASDTRRAVILYDEEGRRVATVGSYTEAATTPKEAASELVRRWNTLPELVEALKDLAGSARLIENIMDGDKDKQAAWQVELAGIYGCVDRATELLSRLAYSEGFRVEGIHNTETQEQ